MTNDGEKLAESRFSGVVAAKRQPGNSPQSDEQLGPLGCRDIELISRHGRHKLVPWLFNISPISVASSAARPILLTIATPAPSAASRAFLMSNTTTTRWRRRLRAARWRKAVHALRAARAVAPLRQSRYRLPFMLSPLPCPRHSKRLERSEVTCFRLYLRMVLLLLNVGWVAPGKGRIHAGWLG